MDEKYYREVIDAVNRNEKEMWGESDADSNEGFEDFAKLWDILNDENAEVTPQTYFEAINLCTNSFFGSVQNPVPVWSNVLKHYQTAINENDSAFIQEFEKYLEESSDSIVEESNFYQFIHIAIEKGDLKMTRLIFNHTPIEAEDWDLLKQVYAEYPEMAVYYEIFGDLTYDWLPQNEPEFCNAIERLHHQFGSLPEMVKLHDYYLRFCR